MQLSEMFRQLLRDSSTNLVTPDAGICFNIAAVRNMSRRKIVGWMQPLYITWSEFSGDYEYPIPGGHVIYYEHSQAHTSWVDDQLRYRQSLLKHLIKKAEKYESQEGINFEIPEKC